MPNHIKDLTGQTFGYLTIIKRHGSTTTKRKRATWLAKCICGNEVIAIGANLTNTNRTPLKSCGCRRGEVLVKTRGSHGMTSHPIWNTWRQMRYRCGNPRSKDWKKYGGRGITVCQRWQKSFVNFLEDMGLSWYPGVSLDRIDNSKGYSLENCRWATPEMQSRNQRTNVIINTPKGAMTVTEAAETFGIKTSTLHARIFRYKYPVKKALHQPIRRKSSTSPMQAPATVL